MYFLRSFSYLFHPLFMPFAGTAIYYIIFPGYQPQAVEKSVIIPVLILTLIVPIVLYFLLRNMGWVRSHELSGVEERKAPLFVAIPITCIITAYIVPRTFSPELHYFFLGILIALFACLFLVFLKVKASIHMMGIAGLTTFVTELGIHFRLNITLLLVLLILAVGAVASSRLYIRAHNTKEIILGILLGVLPQVLVFPYWF
ncbi:hypothetical protein [Sinomicrobium weinanense]|uniref:PAP2 superfamily protein n=1 Tax=Sinomicrobium weinanense TaxID=2842200 RepID=A0A926JNG6_9FLAO|nr:hypothetical protein [Sinomicrobium weinanense]MBC9794535.1 hypothetical protein [Sinomicrobium weinanense]MBU3124442.1 hypothetical protein [Sinomicrobium weinanense]